MGSALVRGHNWHRMIMITRGQELVAKAGYKKFMSRVTPGYLFQPGQSGKSIKRVHWLALSSFVERDKTEFENAQRPPRADNELRCCYSSLNY
ncbi:hypothetical protein RRG08_043516 [Elysia crispata]|uniref:Uncharacterized protein n=1 Tax=Elysia crispata TaxID=231223 RepID=A0AAE0YFI9_9GAST|nr:hypothetical protein RRG08_043516 [Elysia crispata]